MLRGEDNRRFGSEIVLKVVEKSQKLERYSLYKHVIIFVIQVNRHGIVVCKDIVNPDSVWDEDNPFLICMFRIIIAISPSLGSVELFNPKELGS